MKTKTKLLFAKIIYFFLSALKFSTNVKVKRNNINWNLDLSEGIDLSIYLFGKFDPLIIDMAKALNLRKKINIIDIGANIGSHTINFAKEFKSAKIFAIEPTDYSFKKLKKNINLNNKYKKRIFTTQAFITNKSKIPNSVYSSWKLDSRERKHNLHYGIKKNTKLAIKISLDKFIKKNNLSNNILIKCDVDGYELDVLKSGESYLKKYKPPILLELAPYLYNEHGYSLTELIQFIKKMNYDFYFGKSLNKIKDIFSFSKKIKRGSSKNIVLI